jgi:hypothetical protein
MTEGVNDGLIGKDAARGGEIVEHGRVDRLCIFGAAREAEAESYQTRNCHCS